MKRILCPSILAGLTLTLACCANMVWGQSQIQFKVDNKSAGPVTIKILDINLKTRSFTEVDVTTINQDETKDVSVPADKGLIYFQNGEEIGNHSPKPGDTVFLRKPGLEFQLIQIHCSVADDEGPAAFGDEVEFNGKLDVSVKFGDREIRRDPQHIYVEGLDDNSARPLGNVWSFEVPKESVDAAKMTLSWSETWEEDNASSSQDDTLTVEGNHRVLEQVKSLGPFDGSFRIVGTAPGEPDADVSVSYRASAIKEFEVKSK